MDLFPIGLIISAITIFLMLLNYYRLAEHLKVSHPEKHKEYCGQFLFWESKVNTGKGFAGLQWNFFIFGLKGDDLDDDRIKYLQLQIRVFAWISLFVASLELR